MTAVNLHVLAAEVGIDARAMRWMDDARCAEVDPEIFHPAKGDSTREAKAICAACEVRAECLEYALETGQQHGVWGGLSAHQRDDLKRDLRRTAA